MEPEPTAQLNLTRDKLNLLGVAIDIATKQEGIGIAIKLVPLFAEINEAAQSIAAPEDTKENG